MRCFLGFSAEALTKDLHDLQQRLDLPSSGCVPPANLHLTLLFLGNLSASQLSQLSAVLHQTDLPAVPAFRFKRIDRWPLRTDALVVLEADAEPVVVHWRQRLIERLQAEGVLTQPPAQAFRPHITLARQVSSAWAIPSTPPPPLRLAPTVLNVYHSDRVDGPVYRVLQHWPLGRAYGG